MIYVLNLSQPYATLLALLITILCIILGKEFKKSAFPATTLILFLILITIHAIQLTIIEDAYRAILVKSLAIDALMILLSYISYLWVDDIEAKAKNKKSIDNSLEWFWKKV